MNNDDFNMQPNNNNLNLNNQNDINSNPGNQILMGDTSQIDSLSQNMEPLEPQTTLSSTSEPVEQPTVVEPIQSQPEIIPKVEPEQPNPQMEQIQSLNQTTEEVDTIFTETPTIEAPKPKKGKGLKIVITILILTILGIVGYIAYDKLFATQTEPTVTPEKKVEKKALIKDDSKDIVYSDVDEMHDGVVRRIPKVNIDSKYAEEINKEIKDLTKEGYLEGQLKENALEYTVDYQYYINDEIVSLKFSWQTEGNKTISKIYNINMYTGQKVTNIEIMNAYNIVLADLGNVLVESYKAARPFETIENNSDWKESYDKDIEQFQNKIIKGMYINNKEIYVLFDMHYPAGAESGEALLNITSNKFIQDPLKLQ